ncbi:MULTISPECIES: deoxyribose-phosphate aldolase [unclassified Gilliamella]|uniref:deoxyribose-phosphate aldolase n=1 Tax=unclassified Gilliamella TaxID=2685620 RepID=UPI00226A6637|nr:MULTISPECIES: deoxyribose-phosphate aldolase [unclassified Gilliamella]MCX8600889.1 deoxyribose-phosphate aldolase [Gilliamella sp. B3722]MCX8608986.1 deoxyribose-phosphate aldolase [Gilliamella sp. B3771]MCX8610109.1 deoxyribose-phosphate aldolase [Gilliamella sp. B3891]MCX8612631.1 deoxyribose-phosphate aldolase [Gilliamella sp. B3773]MCX8616110.1 deoxyribose-phosphate aldolase [Gilliamella sp. B3770]
MKKYSLAQLSRLIDHTNLKADATPTMMEKLCIEAKNYHFKMVAINQVQSKLCASLLQGSDVGIGAAIAFPLGQTTIEAKCFETQNAIDNGATEIDYVINLTQLKIGNLAYIEDEMSQIVAICRKHQVISKVIFENYYLTDAEKIALCQIAVKVKPDFIKTSTGFAPTGATVEDVKLMKQHVGDTVKVKAAGGIRDANTFIKMLEAGAERIGTSSGIAIIEAIKQTLLDSHQQTIDVQCMK